MASSEWPPKGGSNPDEDATAHIAASSNVHGVTGSVVGTSDTQTLSNKTLENPVIDATDNSIDSAGATAIKIGDTNASGVELGRTGQTTTVKGNLNVEGTTTTVDSATLEVADANITVNKDGTQATADAQDAGLTVEMSDATNAQIGYDSTKESKFVAGEVGSEKEILTDADTQTITNKTIDGDNNTVQNLPETAIKTEAGQADNFFTRNGSGVPESSTKAVPSGAVVGTTDTQTITNKTIDGDNNTVQNLPETAIKTEAGQADNFFTRNGSGVPESSTKAVPTGAVVGTTDTQTLSGKTLSNPVIDATNNSIDSAGATAIKIGDTNASGVELGRTGQTTTVKGNLNVEGTTTTVDSATLEVADANITVNKDGTQATADAQDAGLTVEMSDATNAKIGYDSTKTSKFVAGEVGSEKEILTDADIQTVTNKTFDDAFNVQEIATPSNPSSGYKKIYPKADGKLYTLDSSGNEIEVGSGAGGGSVNLILNPDGDSALDQGATDDIGDWIDSSSGTTSTKSTTASEIPLEDIKANAIKIALAAGTNDYTRVRFQVPAGYQGFVLGLSWTQRVSGLSAEDMKVELYSYTDNYSTGEAEVALYSDDADGDTFIRASDGPYITAFSASKDIEYYELRFINNGGTSGYLSLNEVSADKKGAVYGASVTDPVAYNPVIQGFGTPTTRMEWCQSGKKVEIGGDFTGGTTTANEAQIGLPNSYTVDFKDGSFTKVVGYLERNSTSTTVKRYPLLATNGDTFLNIGADIDGVSSSPTVPIASASTFFSSSERYTLFATVPVAELQGTVSTLSEVHAQNAKVKAYVAANYTLTDGDNIEYDTLASNVDKSSSWTIDGSGEIPVPSYGTYDVSFYQRMNGSNTSPVFANLVTTGSLTSSTELTNEPTGELALSGKGSVTLQAGDTIGIQITGQNLALACVNENRCWIVIERRADRAGTAVGLPIDDNASTTPQKLIPTIYKSEGEGDLGTITNWATVDSKKYRWYVIGKICFYEHRCESTTASSSTTNVVCDLPADVPRPKIFSNQDQNEWVKDVGSIRSTSGGGTPQGNGSLYVAATDNYKIYGYTDSAQSTKLWIVTAFWQID